MKYQPKKAADSFQGKICRACGTTVRYVSNRQCMYCKKTKGKLYSQSVKGKAAKERFKPKAILYEQSPKCKAYRKSSEYRERIRAYQAGSKWKFVHQVAARKNKLKRKQVEGSYSVQEWLTLKENYGNICLCCRKHENELTKLLQQDHVVPVSKGGSNWISNIQPLCADCNGMAGKGTKVIDYRPENK